MVLSILEIINDLFPTTDENSKLSHAFNFYPKVDMKEVKTEGGCIEIVIIVELSGMKKEDITLEIRNDNLILTGEKVQLEKDTIESFLIFERTFGKFRRCFKIPSDLKFEQVKATFQDGLLTIRYPKSSIANQTHKYQAIDILSC